MAVLAVQIGLLKTCLVFRKLEQRSLSVSRATHAHGEALFLVVYSRRVAAPQSRYFKMVFTWYGKELTESLTALVIL